MNLDPEFPKKNGEMKAPISFRLNTAFLKSAATTPRQNEAKPPGHGDTRRSDIYPEHIVLRNQLQTTRSNATCNFTAVLRKITVEEKRYDMRAIYWLLLGTVVVIVAISLAFLSGF